MGDGRSFKGLCRCESRISNRRIRNVYLHYYGLNVKAADGYFNFEWTFLSRYTGKEQK